MTKMNNGLIDAIIGGTIYNYNGVIFGKGKILVEETNKELKITSKHTGGEWIHDEAKHSNEEFYADFVELFEDKENGTKKVNAFLEVLTDYFEGTYYPSDSQIEHYIKNNSELELTEQDAEERMIEEFYKNTYFNLKIIEKAQVFREFSLRLEVSFKADLWLPTIELGDTEFNHHYVKGGEVKNLNIWVPVSIEITEEQDKMTSAEIQDELMTRQHLEKGLMKALNDKLKVDSNYLTIDDYVILDYIY